MSIAKYQTTTVAGPAPVTTPDYCTVNDVRWSLHTAWQEAEAGAEDTFLLLSHLLRLVVSVAIGQTRGSQGHLREIRVLADSLADIPAVQSLIASLEQHEDVWDAHIAQGSCPTQTCDISAISPCRQACPSGINIPNFLAEIAHGNHAGAVDIIVQDNPLPLVCGVVCPAPCEDACVRGAKDDEPVFIREMKALAAEQTLASSAYPHREIAPSSGKHVGILGSGPSALSAAWYLSLMGHKVTCFEKQSAPGGMLRYGIPGFRLPAEILEQEIEQIRHLGVEFRTNTEIKNVEDLQRDHDAVFIAVGTPVSRALPLPGVNNDFVHGAIEFLRAVRDDREIPECSRL
ncbi:MAG: hypothetical protein DRR06_19595, partial [Gammaproteobacteria bacterium]